MRRLGRLGGGGGEAGLESPRLLEPGDVNVGQKPHQLGNLIDLLGAHALERLVVDPSTAVNLTLPYQIDTASADTNVIPHGRRVGNHHRVLEPAQRQSLDVRLVLVAAMNDHGA